MARAKKWPNEEMWRQVAEWRAGGMTFSDICGLLSRPENLKRFRLKEVPSEDTVRREMRRRQPGSRLGDPLRQVREEVAVQHVGRLTRMAEELDRQLSLPSPSGAGSWVPTQAAPSDVVPVWIGYPDPLRQPWWSWEPAEGGAGIVQLSVERDEYFVFLRDHVPAEEAWGLLVPWRARAANYFYACRQLAEVIAEVVKRRTKCKVIRTEQEFPQEGVGWGFFGTVYRHHTMLAQEPRNKGSGIWPYCFPERKSRVPAQGMIQTLQYGALEIAWHRRKAVRDQWQGVHQKLLATAEFAQQAEALTAQHRALESQIAGLRAVLNAEIERPIFDRGHCPRCP